MDRKPTIKKIICFSKFKKSFFARETLYMPAKPKQTSKTAGIIIPQSIFFIWAEKKLIKQQVYWFIVPKNSFSVMVFTPNLRAWSAFLPGSEPTTTKSVFKDTDEETSPPSSRIFFFASSRVIDSNPPVSTNVFPKSFWLRYPLGLSGFWFIIFTAFSKDRK